MKNIVKISMINAKANLVDFIYDETKNIYTVSSDKIKYVLSSEGESHRTLKTLADANGQDAPSYFSVHADVSEVSKALIEQCGSKLNAISHLKRVRHEISKNGFFHNGVHYMVWEYGASQLRNVNIMFISVKAFNPVAALNEIKHMRSVVTKLNYFDPTDPYYVGAKFGDKDQKVFMSKVHAYENISSSGSMAILYALKNAGVTQEQYDKVVETLRGIKTAIVPDLETVVKSTHFDIEKREEVIGKTKAVLEDGGALGGRKLFLAIGLALRCFNVEQYEEATRRLLSNETLRLIAKVNSFIQIRLASCKGGLVFVDLEKYTTDDYGAVVFKSCYKYDVPENEYGNKLDWSQLAICNASHNGKGFVNTNSPFICSLTKSNPDVMKEIVEHWMDKVMKVFDKDPIVAAQNVRYIMNAYSAENGEEEESNNDDLQNLTYVSISNVLDNNALLLHDANIWTQVKKRVNAFVNNISVGRVPVPGDYPPIFVDPLYVLKELVKHGDLTASSAAGENGCNIPTLNKGKYYYNNKSCRGVIARSPLTHPAQVKVIQLEKNSAYSVYRNVLLLNAEEAIWVDLSGADVDGDKVLLVLEEERGSFKAQWVTSIINGVENKMLSNIIPAIGADREPYSDEARLAYLDANATPSQIGILNNYYVNWLELYNHLRAIGSIAVRVIADNKLNNDVQVVKFVNEDLCGKDYVIDGSVMKVKALPKDRTLDKFEEDLKKSYKENTKRDKGFVFGNDNTFSVREIAYILKMIKAKLDLCEKLQSDEVDKAKTGKGAESKLVDKIAFNLISYANIARRYFKCKYGDINSKNKQTVERAKQAANNAAINGYKSLSALGNMLEMIEQRRQEIKDKQTACQVKLGAYLYLLLNDKERECLFAIYDGVDKMRIAYNSAVQSVMKVTNTEAEVKSLQLKKVRSDAIKSIYDFSSKIKCPLYMVAVAAYEGCYMKQSGMDRGLSYAWLLHKELMKVFSRGDRSYAYCLLTHPEFADKGRRVAYGEGFTDDNGDVYVPTTLNGKASDIMLYCGSTLKRAFDKNQKFIVHQSISCAPTMYAKLACDNPADLTVTPCVEAVRNNNKFVNIGLINCVDGSEIAMRKIGANGWKLRVTIDENGRPVAMVGNEIVSEVSLGGVNHLRLVNQTLQMFNDGTMLVTPEHIQHAAFTICMPEANSVFTETDVLPSNKEIDDLF